MQTHFLIAVQPPDTSNSDKFQIVALPFWILSMAQISLMAFSGGQGRHLFAAVLILLCLTVELDFASAAETVYSAEQWKQVSIYQIMTDRFNNPANTPCEFSSNYCGGTFKGIQNKVGYLKGERAMPPRQGRRKLAVANFKLINDQNH